MKKILLFILFLVSALMGLSVAPSISGNGTTDSVTIVVPINDIDTVQVYTAMDITASDQIAYYYYGPDGVLVGADTNSANITKIMDGVYKIRLKSSNASSALGDYHVVVQVYFKGKWRAAGSESYYVIDETLATYFDYTMGHMYYNGACDDCTQTWYPRVVGAYTVTDSIVIRDSASARKAKVTYARAAGSTVITSITYERF